MKKIFFVLLVFSLILTSCGKNDSGENLEVKEKIRVVVSIPPQAYFVKRIGGEWIQVEALVKPGMSPHTYDPSPKQISDLSQAKVYFTIGMPFEFPLKQKISSNLKNLKVVDTRTGIELLPMMESSGPHSPSDGNYDPHIWLDPVRVKVQAETIYRALVDLAPIHKEDFNKNLTNFEKDLDTLNVKISNMLKPYKGSEFYIFHPSFGYFAQRYGLVQKAIETGGKEPGARKLSELIMDIKKSGARVIYSQLEFSPRTAEVIAKSIQGEVIQMTPLAEDYLNNMMDITQKIILGFNIKQKI
jgi:zinc transport system substrate-binding protein